MKGSAGVIKKNLIMENDEIGFLSKNKNSTVFEQNQVSPNFNPFIQLLNNEIDIYVLNYSETLANVAEKNKTSGDIRIQKQSFCVIF